MEDPIILDVDLGPEYELDLSNPEGIDFDLDTPIVIRELSLQPGDYVVIVDDTISVVTTDTIEQGNGAPVSSDAVYNALAEITDGPVNVNRLYQTQDTDLVLYSGSSDI